MTTTILPAPRKHHRRGARLPPMVVGVAVLVLLLGIGAGVWQARRHAGPPAAQPEVAEVSPAAGWLTGTTAAADEEWAAFLRAIHQPAPPGPGSDLPVYDVLLGITTEADASGAQVVKRLVLDLGDYSVHVVDLPAP